MNRYMPLVILVVFGQAVIAYLLVVQVAQHRLSGPTEELEEVKVEVTISDAPERIYRDLGEFIVNPADTISSGGLLRLLKMQLALGVSPPEIYDQIAAREPLVRDAILRIMSSKVVAEIDDPEDREFIKDEILVEVGRLLPRSKNEALIHVYFTEFIIQ